MPSRSTQMTRARVDDAVYWAVDVYDDGTGARVYDAPVALKVRWEDTAETFTDENGQQISSDAVVYVGQALEVGAYIWLGELNQVASAALARPEMIEDAREVRVVERIANLDASRVLRRALLKRK